MSQYPPTSHATTDCGSVFGLKQPQLNLQGQSWHIYAPLHDNYPLLSCGFFSQVSGSVTQSMGLICSLPCYHATCWYTSTFFYKIENIQRGAAQKSFMLKFCFFSQISDSRANVLWWVRLVDDDRKALLASRFVVSFTENDLRTSDSGQDVVYGWSFSNVESIRKESTSDMFHTCWKLGWQWTHHNHINFVLGSRQVQDQLMWGLIASHIVCTCATLCLSFKFC